MPEYRRIESRFGPLWLHHCAALENGPDWARRERLLIDAGARNSRLIFQGSLTPFHGHLFRKTDGLFRFSEKDRRAYPPELLNQLETIVNTNLQ
jgi:hypothetical protein